MVANKRQLVLEKSIWLVWVSPLSPLRDGGGVSDVKKVAPRNFHTVDARHNLLSAVQ